MVTSKSSEGHHGHYSQNRVALRPRIAEVSLNGPVLHLQPQSTLKTANHQRISFSIKFAPKISATAYGKITFNFQQQCCKFAGGGSAYGYGYNGIPAFGFTFLKSKHFCGRALQCVPQRNIRWSLHQDRVRAGNFLYRHLGPGREVLLLRYYCR